MAFIKLRLGLFQLAEDGYSKDFQAAARQFATTHAVR
jgi:hypothetical protein